MSIEEENKAGQLRVFEEIINKRNFEIMSELFTPNYSFSSPLGIEIKGADGFKEGMVRFSNAFPDIHCRIDDMFAEGDKVATRYTMTGTFKGEYMGVAPTGKKFEIIGILITCWVDGKEVKAWESRDMLGFYQQLRIPIPGQ